MHITKIRTKEDGCTFFNLNVGGFTIKNCRWYRETRQIYFPVRYGASERLSRWRFRVVLTSGSLVKRLRTLLESGQDRSPRDRRSLNLKIGRCHFSREYNVEQRRDMLWVIFNFTVRGFTILHSRWHPESGSIQLPVTFFPIKTGNNIRYRKQKVVCAYGAAINQLRRALETARPDLVFAPAPVREEINEAVEVVA